MYNKNNTDVPCNVYLVRLQYKCSQLPSCNIACTLLNTFTTKKARGTSSPEMWRCHNPNVMKLVGKSQFYSIKL